MANLLKVFGTVFVADLFTNVAFAYMVGVQPTQQVFLMSGIFAIIVSLLLSQVGVLGGKNTISLPIPKTI